MISFEPGFRQTANFTHHRFGSSFSIPERKLISDQGPFAPKVLFRAKFPSASGSPWSFLRPVVVDFGDVLFSWGR